MSLTLNKSHENLFKTAWSNHLQKIAGRTKEIPSSPGTGFLSGIAAKYNLCTAIFYNSYGEDGFSVCGNPVSEADPYLCEKCIELKEKLKLERL